MKIEGAVAVIAGGGGGFGSATARELNAAGARVLLLDLDEEKGEAVAADLGEGAAFVRTDVTDPASVEAALERAEALGPIRIAVIAHGGPGAGRTLDRENRPLELDRFRQVVEIFLVGSFNLLSRCASRMASTEPQADGERGVIINTASIAAFEGTIGQAAYSAAKGGIVGMTLPIARDLAAVGVRCVTIAPGTFLTPAYGDVDPEKLDAHWGAAIPFPKRMGRPEEYAIFARQICENPYLNGETIRLDGALRFTPKGAG